MEEDSGQMWLLPEIWLETPNSEKKGKNSEFKVRILIFKQNSEFRKKPEFWVWSENFEGKKVNSEIKVKTWESQVRFYLSSESYLMRAK